MNFHVYKMWDLLIPHWDEAWYKSLNIDGIMILGKEYGYWKNNAEYMTVVRIACTEERIKEIMALSADFFDEDVVLSYKVNDYCLMGVA